jgi:hypothetical protein
VYLVPDVYTNFQKAAIGSNHFVVKNKWGKNLNIKFSLLLQLIPRVQNIYCKMNVIWGKNIKGKQEKRGNLIYKRRKKKGKKRDN